MVTYYMTYAYSYEGVNFGKDRFFSLDPTKSLKPYKAQDCIEYLATLALPDALWWFIENTADNSNPDLAAVFSYLADRKVYSA